MNRVALSMILLGSVALPTSSASATQFIYEAALSGANEAPPNASPGTGFTTVTYDDQAHTLRVQATFADLTGITTASHIHIVLDPSLSTGPVFTQVPTFSGFPLGVQSGTYDHTFDLTQASSWNPSQLNSAFFLGNVTAIEAFFASSLQEGRAYLNVHTNFAPGGEIRGFLAPAVPEPDTWALLLFGFGLVGAAMRQRNSPPQVVSRA